jgi:hypothetical protein
MACPSKGETLLVRAKTLAQRPLRAQSVRKGPAGRGNPRTWRFHREQRGTISRFFAVLSGCPSQLGSFCNSTSATLREPHSQTGKDTRAEAAESAERAKGACGAGEPVDMAIPSENNEEPFAVTVFLYFSTFIDLH